MTRPRFAMIAAALSLTLLSPALAGNTNFLTEKGTINFPFSPPNRATPGPGLIDNMTIGATTPAPGNFSTLTSTSAPSGTGITALFAAPPAIGGTTPAAGAFTTLGSTGLATLASLKVDTGTKTATATSGAATLNKGAGVITSEDLTTAAGATWTLTLTDSAIAAADEVTASVQLGTATTGLPAVATVTPGAGSAVVVVQNIHASAALNGTIKVAFVVHKN